MEEKTLVKDERTKKLLLGLLFDAIGMVSFTIPFLGEFADVIWAPLAGFLMTYMYKGRVGKVAGILTFVEEILPFTDIIPSFTLTWVYTYFIQKKDKHIDNDIIL
ncbi:MULTISPECIES: hypothetical protein [unclassified Flavobacterium]|uniref:hypothetical protein n=1 Tax=unclassified Flavobacterium TaxID=196869 RepID=UPI00057FEBBC|nr:MULTISPECIES: hypothetical protein [unclassified Flavobacterium]KIA98842.1 hypothetical protein OA93_08130 [Flavobacterium sp. KMS]KIC03647.1 hypothetical protein OA88_02540 [Flavobacterium sp. JRM]MEA9412064.1 hypothetical protein [Flavobacterium sp. PL02]